MIGNKTIAVKYETEEAVLIIIYLTIKCTIFRSLLTSNFVPQAFPDQPPPNSVFVSNNPPPYPGVMGVTYPPGPGASGMPNATGAAATAPPGYPGYPGYPNNQAGFSHNPPPPGYPGGFAAPGATANNMSPRGKSSVKILKL